MKKLSDGQIARMQQLVKVGYPIATVAKLFDVDRSVVSYHVKNIKRIQLEQFLSAMLPHTPLQGPPLPRGWTPTWSQLSKQIKTSR